MKGYHAVNGEIQLTEDPKTLRVVKEERELHYPLIGVIPPINGKGKAIYFRTTDNESYDTLINLGTLLNSAHNELARYRNELSEKIDRLDLLTRESEKITTSVDKRDFFKDQRIKFLEAIVKELLSNILTLIPINLQTSGEDGKEPLKLENVVDYWMTRAKISYEPGEVKPKRYYSDKGSF